MQNSALDGSGGRPFKSRLMPENKDKSQDRRKDAPKKPDRPKKGDGKPKGADREARLAEALRANLRRRKAPKAGDGGPDVEKEE